MKSRDGTLVKRPCNWCGEPTFFLFEIVGKRGGHKRWVDCCTDCGEQPARRAEFEKQKKQTKES